MKAKRWRNAMLTTILAGGTLLAGPCGITTLQFQDFLTQTLIRTGVTAVASLVESATIAQSQDVGGG